MHSSISSISKTADKECTTPHHSCLCLCWLGRYKITCTIHIYIKVQYPFSARNGFSLLFNIFGWKGISIIFIIRQEAERHKEHLSLLETEASHGVGGILSRNCSEIDWTFEYGPPFLHMSLPMCGDVIRPNMILKRENLTCELDPAFLPNNQVTKNWKEGKIVSDTESVQNLYVCICIY